MRIDFRIEADSEDITDLIRDRLVSVEITDAAGIQSDTARIVIDNRDYRVEFPPVGAELRIALGFRETGLTDMGLFTVDELGGEGPIATMEIAAKAADMLSGIRAPKTRAWKGRTLGEIGRTIAGEHGLAPAIAPALAGTAYAYLAQTAESDLHFLTRLARDLDATVKPAGGRLLIVRRGAKETADGQPIPPVRLDRGDLDTWSWRIAGRGKYRSAVGLWAETGTATVHRETVGSGEPVLELRHRHPTREEAQRAARAALTRSQRDSASISAECGGFYPELFAEAPVDLRGIEPELVGVWPVNRVSHRLSDNALRTSFEAGRDNEEEEAE